MFYYALCAIIGYLLGNVQFAVILSKWKYKDDVRNHGSGNAGSTNMLRVFGLKSGLITFVGDFLKGVIAVLIGRWIGGEIGGYACALFVVLGHDFPALLRFKGGKGVASTFAILWMLNPLYAAIVTGLALIILFTTRIVALASLVCMTAYALLIIVLQSANVELLVLILGLWVLMVVRHVDNIKRLFRGEESRLFDKKKENARNLK